MIRIMADALRIPGGVATVLQYYVYALRDPRDGRVFDVGKGIGDRINAYAREAGKDLESERAKLRTINEIEAAGQRVDLLFLRTGIGDRLGDFLFNAARCSTTLPDVHASARKEHVFPDHRIRS